MTASWYTPLPPGHMRVGISRGVPRRTPAGYRRYMALAPGAWFNSVMATEYLSRYRAILDSLNPQQVADDLVRLADGQTPVVLCYESPAKIAAGEQWCHRHIVAQWLEDRLGIEVPEVGHPSLNRWAMLRREGVEPPSFTPRQPVTAR